MARMQLWQAKIVATVGLLVAMLFATLLPLCVKSFFKNDNGKGATVISYLSVFGGGVFLAIYLLILAPEFHLLLRLTLMEPYQLHYPVPELVVAGGFFLMVLVAKVLHTLESRYGAKSKKGYMLLLIALSFTNILEGLSIGFQRSNKGVWNLVLAILIMDSVVSFCMGLQMITDIGEYEHDHLLQKVKHRDAEEEVIKVSAGKSERSELNEADVGDDDEKKLYGSIEDPSEKQVEGEYKVRDVVISAFVYSAMTSMGILIGTVVMHFTAESPGLNLANGLLQAIAAGTFLYTTFFEVLFGELQADSPVAKLVTLVLGFGMIALLCIEAEEMIETAVEELGINSTTLVPVEIENATTTTTIASLDY